MQLMSEFEELAVAFQAARSRAHVARDAERRLLHRAIANAHESGKTIREVAEVLRAPVSTVASHWRDGHYCPDIPPTWGNPEEYLLAENEIWKHAPWRADRVVPYQWVDHTDGSRTVEPKEFEA